MAARRIFEEEHLQIKIKIKSFIAVNFYSHYARKIKGELKWDIMSKISIYVDIDKSDITNSGLFISLNINYSRGSPSLENIVYKF